MPFTSGKNLQCLRLYGGLRLSGRQTYVMDVPAVESGFRDVLRYFLCDGLLYCCTTAPEVTIKRTEVYIGDEFHGVRGAGLFRSSSAIERRRLS